MAEDNGFAMGYALGQDNNGGGGGFGGNFGEGLWAVIILAILFGRGGFGGGFGGFGGGGDCATQADLAAGFNNSTVLSSLDDIKLGQANAINYNNQGFAGLNTAVIQGFHGVDNAICTLGYQNQQGFNELGHQLSDCCCTTQRAIDGVNYNMAKGFCDLGNVIQTNTRDIIDSQNAGTRAILDFLTNEKIDSLRAENQTLRFQASQVAQNQYLVDQLRPCPVPAFITCNPYSSIYGGYNGGNACGCGCG